MKIKTLSAMIDCSRNAVMKLSSVKEFLLILKRIGYNAAMLYTEDTYEIPEYPLFGYMRGRYTVDELRELDDYAASIGMELIPCIQTLGHLELALKWDFLPKESRDILLPDDERSYEFIDRAFATLSRCYRSRRIHIGLDEAFGLGTGELLRRNGYEKPIPIIKRHLARIKEIADKYGYTILCWSDMFFTEWNEGKYWIEKREVPRDVTESVPNGVIPVYWDYYSTDFNRYDGMIYNHRQLTSEPWFAGAVWGWRGMIPYNNFTIKCTTAALDACEKNGVENIMICLWGDDGNECSRYSELPSLYYIAKYARGERDADKIKEGFLREFGVPFDDYMQIDDPNRPGNPDFSGCDYNPSKFMLYSDYFNGFKDWYVDEEAGEKYAEYAKNLEEISTRVDTKASFAFKAAAKLCEVLYHKYALGLRTRRAYRAGDRSELLRLVEDHYTPLLTLLPEYLNAFRVQWFAENKPSGFDLQDMRIGGVIARTVSCRQRLLDYIECKCDSIDELEEELIEFPNIGWSKWRSGRYLFTPNVFEGI
ncbi:MAG: beta-N-acetylhexosaminidase [Clostridia bacterium]|nr:beta-N-acetylhexosaminidase [Clostridia bacterium]